jgi:hypothetical protein
MAAAGAEMAEITTKTQHHRSATRVQITLVTGLTAINAAGARHCTSRIIVGWLTL